MPGEINIDHASNDYDSKDVQSEDTIVAFIVSRDQIKAFNALIATTDLLHTTLKTKPYQNEDGVDAFALPSSLPLSAVDESQNTLIRHLTGDHGGYSLSDVKLKKIPISFFTSRSRPKPESPEDIILTTFDNWLTSQDDDVITTLSPLRSELPKTFTIYPPLLLFPSTAFKSQLWIDLLPPLSSLLSLFFSSLSTRMKVSHIAINAPIPPRTSSSDQLLSSTNGDESNILRSPSNLRPLFGHFPPLSSRPCPSDFFVSTVQNGIKQTWAPQYTMFSAGNIREKTRLLTLSSVHTAIGQGKESRLGCAVVDLYVGIGYFAFSYLKTGVDLVLGWDLNSWSLEGLRRGAGMNKWSSKIVHQSETESSQTDELDLVKDEKDGLRLIGFEGSNVLADSWIRQNRARIPPIRHVNCGLLPTSKDSWSIAVAVLDHQLGGWIHVHENFAVEEMKEKSEHVRSSIQSLVEQDISWPENTTVSIDGDVFRVKSYAPGVFHYVIDIHISLSP